MGTKQLIFCKCRETDVLLDCVLHGTAHIDTLRIEMLFTYLLDQIKGALSCEVHFLSAVCAPVLERKISATHFQGTNFLFQSRGSLKKRFCLNWTYNSYALYAEIKIGATYPKKLLDRVFS